MKLRIVLLGGNFIEADVAGDINLSAMGQSCAACTFFCNGQVFVPYANIEAMFLYDPEKQEAPLVRREKMN